MNILTLGFEESLTIMIDGQKIQVFAFKTTEPGNIKFGIDAPRSIQVHREEIYKAIHLKKEQDE